MEKQVKYEIVLNPVFAAKLQVLVESKKAKSGGPADEKDVVNAATALGLNMML